MRSRGGGGEDDGGRRIEKLRPVVLTDAEDVEPDFIGPLDTVEELPEKARDYLARLEEPGDTVQSAHYRSRPDGERDLRSLFAPVQAEVQRLGAEAHGIAAQLLDMRNEDIGLDTEAGTAPIGTDPALHRLFTELRSKHWGLDFGDSDEERGLFVP